MSDVYQVIRNLLDVRETLELQRDAIGAQWIDDAIAALKEKETVKPLDENYWKHTMGRCGHCKAPLPAIEGLRSKFCWMCGKAVKWDE